MKKYIRILIGVCAMLILLMFATPFAVTNDGFVKRVKVDSYHCQYLESAHEIIPHEYEKMKSISLFYFGVGDVKVREDFYGEYPAVKKPLPFVYQWDVNKKETAYRVTIGNSKYYFAYLPKV